MQSLRATARHGVTRKRKKPTKIKANKKRCLERT